MRFILALLFALAPVYPSTVSIAPSRSVVTPGATYTYTLSGDWDGTFAFVPHVGDRAELIGLPDGCIADGCSLAGDGTEHAYVFTARTFLIAAPGCISFTLTAHTATDALEYNAACVWYHDDRRVWLPFVSR